MPLEFTSDYERDLALGADLILGSARHWSPHKPFGRQKIFLSELKGELEVLYGGAARGMKSEALLHAALEYVDTPGYSALILRRNYTDLTKPGALMDRAADWLRPHIPAAKWSSEKKQWRFPSGAVLQFGFLEHENDKYQYQSAEFQFIAFDELTQFTESQYLYLFSRLTRSKNAQIPIRMRSATNPGGEGHEWVKLRFIPDDWTADQAGQMRAWSKTGADETGKPFKTFFVPSRYTDNPFIDQVAYREVLDLLPEVEREQLTHGDWSIAPGGRMFFNRDAIRRFTAIPPAVGELLQVENQFGEPRLDLVLREGGILSVWKKPERGHWYVMGSDAASGRDLNRGRGKTDPDWSVSNVRDQGSGEQVARLRGRISETHLGEYNYRLHKWYNDAYLVPLVTGGYGQSALDTAMRLGLPPSLIYKEHDERKASAAEKENLGYVETIVSRPKLYGWLDSAITTHSIETYDAVTINEYQAFEINKDGIPKARNGCHDDCVAADAASVVGIMRAPKRVDTSVSRVVKYATTGQPVAYARSDAQRAAEERARVDGYKARM